LIRFLKYLRCICVSLCGPSVVQNTSCAISNLFDIVTGIFGNDYKMNVWCYINELLCIADMDSDYLNSNGMWLRILTLAYSVHGAFFLLSD